MFISIGSLDSDGCCLLRFHELILSDSWRGAVGFQGSLSTKCEESFLLFGRFRTGGSVMNRTVVACEPVNSALMMFVSFVGMVCGDSILIKLKCPMIPLD